MRGTVLVARLVVACAIAGAAQGTSNGLGLPTGPEVSAKYATFATKEVVVLSGDVTIATPGVTATADRATFHPSSQTFQLEGHVHLSTP